MVFSRTFTSFVFVATCASLSLCAPSKIQSLLPGTNLASTSAVNALSCADLSIYDYQQAELIAKACTAAKSVTSIHLRERSSTGSAVGAHAGANVDASVFLNLFNTCNGLSQVLTNAIGGTAMLVSGLVSNLVVPILTHTTQQLEATVATLNNVVACTDATVAATVYEAFKVFASVQKKLFVFISANVSLLVKLNLKSTVHTALVGLDKLLETYLEALFTYISEDLDTLSLRASLTASIKSAIAACA
ncbi:secreted protein [Melampsora americana]|nr:secreted protein [Melampsora americana]